MEDIKYRPVGKQDERLDYVKDMCKQAVEMFLEAMKKMEFGMRFKAFEFHGLKDEEINPLSDVITTAIAIELKAQAKDTLDSITYDCKVDKCDTEEGRYDFWITARREKPDWNAIPKMEETSIEDITIPKLEDVSGCSGENTVNYIV